MAKIWRNRIEAGTKKLANCPSRYRDDVIDLIRADLMDGSFSVDNLSRLVEDGMMTQAEYNEIMDGVELESPEE